MYKKAHLVSDFRKKISPQLGLEPTKWDKKWVFAWISFSERERKVKLALIDFSKVIEYVECKLFNRVYESKIQLNYQDGGRDGGREDESDATLNNLLFGYWNQKRLKIFVNLART